MDFLQQQGISVKVIPGMETSNSTNCLYELNLLTMCDYIVIYSGITSASGIAAELGIPLTHRGVANR